MKKNVALSRSISSLLALSAFVPASVQAVSDTWDGSTNALWATNTNWLTDPAVVPGSGDTATFSGAGNGFLTIDLGAGVTIKSILFDSPSVGAYTIGAGALGSQTLTLDNAGSITVGAAVTNSEVVNASLVLGNDGTAQTFSLLNGSTSAGQALIIAGGITGSAGAGVKTVAIGGAGNTLVSGVIGNGTTGSVTVTKNDTGTLTLSGANTFTGGTTLNGGRINLNHASALGSTAAGNLIVNGGTIDNTSGAAITTTTAKGISLLGDLTVLGTNELNFNGGALALGGTAGTRTLAVNAGTFRVGTITGAAGVNLAKTGAGTLFLTSTANNASTIGGILDIQAGKVQLQADVTLGGLTGSGTIENGGGASKWLFVNNAADNVFSGNIIGNASNTAVRLGLVKGGTGTLTLGGTVGSPTNGADTFDVRNGRVVLTATAVAYVGGNNFGQLGVGTVNGQNGILEINGATVNSMRTGSPMINVGTAAGARGFVKMTSGTVNTASSTVGELWVSNNLTSFGEFTMTGGTVNTGSWVAVGRSGPGILNISGGAINVATQPYVHGSFTGATGVTNLSGTGAINVNSAGAVGMYIAENGNGILNMTGGTLNVASTATNGLNLTFAAGTGIANLNGGTATVPNVRKTGAGTGILNFSGGTLRPNGSNAAFLQGLTSAYIQSGGATIDSNGFDITVAQPLLAPTGSGIATIPVATGGVGYVDAPLVTISGGTGAGATAVANVTGGVVTGITITNPGVDYLPTDVVTVTLVGGGATTAATVGSVAYAPNAGGGLTKTGQGSLALAAASTYTGPTTVNAGTLLIEGGATINSSSGVIVNGTGAKLVHTGFESLAPTVTLTNGTLDGTGRVGSVFVGDGTGGVITHGNGAPGPLTIGSLTFNGAGVLSLRTTAGSPEPLIVTNLVTGATNPAGKITLDVANTSGIWTNGVYNLISYSTLGGAGFNSFAKGTLPGLGARQSATLTNPAGFIALTIGGDFPIWTGAQNGNWTTSVVGGASNWKLQTAGTPTDFITGDTVVFDDTATGTTALTITGASVNPTSTTFDNSVKDYSVSSPGGFGIAGGSLVKSGLASLTLNTANTYAGGTTLNAGRLNINNASALGTGAFTINGGTIDNTSAAPVTLTSNNAQNWNADFTFGGTSALNLGTGAVTLNTTRLVTTDGTAPLTVGGVISGSGFGINKLGPGALVLAGANTYTGTTDVNGGTLTLTGSINAANAANAGQISAENGGTLRIVGGTVNATKTAAPAITAGNISGSTGAIYLDGGTLNVTQEFWLGSPAGGFGGFTMNSGAVTTGNWFAVGRSGNGILNVNGGTLGVTTQNLVLASFVGANGVATLTGGTTSVTSVAANQGAFIVGEAGVGVLNMTGTAALNASGALGLNIARVAGGTGIVNLNGGTVTVPAVTKGAGNTAIVNFNGGTLRPTASNAAFMTGLNAAYLYSGGANIDTNGHAITISQPLIAPTGNGLTTTGLTVTGSGFITPPLILISGGGGTGATAVPILDAAGNLNGITITNPGVDYTTDPVVFEVIGGGGTGSITGTPTLVANASGGLTKLGAGTLTLNAQSTYGGTTNVNAGTLRISNATGSATGTGTVSVNDGGTLTGGGIIAGSIVGATGGTISPGENGVGTLTTGALTLNAGSTLNYEWDAALANDRITVTGADGLTINGGRFKLLNTGAATTFGTNGVYNLISFLGNIGGAGLSALGVDPTSVLVGKSYSFGQSGGFVTLAIGNTGVTPNFWNVDASGDWTTSTNWSLGTAPNAPQAFAAFGGGSTVISAPRTVTLNANQTVGTVAFNSVQPFTINGTNTLTLDNGTDPAQITVSGGSHTLAVPMNAVSTAVQFSALNPSDALTVSGALSGTTAVAKVGAGSVTLSGANTYTGTTSVNSGTLALSGIGKLGNVSNPLVVFGGTLDLGGTSQSVGAATITGGTVTNGTLTPASTSISGTGNLTISANIGGTGGLNKTGANTVTLAGNNSYTGATTLNGGALAITNNNSLGAATSPINFTAGSLLVEGTGATTLGTRPLTGFPTLINVAADGHTFTVGQNFTATAALMKRGLGTLALSGTSNFPAAFVVNAGTVHITAGTVTDTATTNVPVQIANEANSTATLTVSGNAVLTTGPSEIFVGQGFPTAVGVLNLQDSGTINTNNWVAVGRGNGVGTVNMSGGTFNKLGGNGNHVTIGSNTATSVGTFNQSGGVVNSADSEFWVGESGTGTYNISGNAQANLLALRLGVNASGNGTANLNGGTVNTGQVVNVGTGALNFNGGTLRAVAPVAEFVGASVQTTVQAGGAIIDTNGFSTSLSSFLSHDPSLDMDGGLRKRGEGVLTVTNAASYNGPTVVEAGTLALGGSISGSANIAVRAGATLNPTAAGDFLLNSIQTLGGSGTVLGNVNTETGARLSPGDDIGNLTIGGNLNLTLAVTPNASAALIFGLAGTNDRITLTTGSVAIGTGLLGFNDFAFTTLTGFAPGTYTLFDTSTAISGSLDNANLTGSLGGFTGTLGFAESGQDLVLVVVPEPGSAALLLASFGSLLGLRRFRSGQRS